MVRKLPIVAVDHQATDTDSKKDSPKKQSPEDASMKDGLFREYNTEAPTQKNVLPLFSLKHKTAIVSGAGAGIGLQVARGFAEAGANVAICEDYWCH